GNVDNGKGRLVADQFFLSRLDEHISGEESVPCSFGNHPYRKALFRARADKAVLNKEILAMQIGKQPLVESIELFRVKRTVDFPPVDIIMTGRFIDNEFIVRCPTSIMTGLNRNRPQMSSKPFATC